MKRFDVRLIPTPDWANPPDIFVNMLLADYQTIQIHRERMLEVVHGMIDDFFNVTGYIAEAHSDGFPREDVLSGEYYIGCEWYKTEVGPKRFRISIQAYCLSRQPERGIENRNYLGLEAWLECLPNLWEFVPVTHLNKSVI